LLGLRVSSSASLWLERRIKSPDCRVFFGQNPVSATGGIWVARVRNFQEVSVSLTEKILEEGIDMHCAHPSLQSDRVLLYLLYRLAFGNVGRFDTEVLSKLTPSLDFFGIELDDQFPQSKSFEFLVIAARWGVELGAKCRCICV
jgi:hypothetical protein